MNFMLVSWKRNPMMKKLSCASWNLKIIKMEIMCPLR